MSNAAERSDMTAAEARAAVDAIRRDVDDLIERIGELWARRAWFVLGYASWAELCAAEFPDRRLPKEERRATVVSLRDKGMSTRAIAAATGNHFSTVARDVVEGVANATPGSVTGTDGRSYAATPWPAGGHVDVIRDLAKLGLSAIAISEQLGLSDGRVNKIARDAGIPIGKNSKLARAQRVEQIRQLAAEGATSHQIAAELGITFNAVRNSCRDHGIAVPADATSMVRGTLNSARIVEGTVETLDGIAVMFDHIDYGSLPLAEVGDWISVLESSIRSLTTLKHRLKELIQP